MSKNGFHAVASFTALSGVGGGSAASFDEEILQTRLGVECVMAFFSSANAKKGRGTGWRVRLTLTCMAVFDDTTLCCVRLHDARAHGLCFGASR
jgi:hypothetical protein